MRLIDVLKALAAQAGVGSRPDDPEALRASGRLLDAFWGFVAALVIVLAYCMGRWLLELQG